MNLESYWVPYPTSDRARPFKKAETFLAMCGLSLLFREVLHHNRSEDMNDGSAEDIDRRVELYMKLQQLDGGCPTRLCSMAERPAHLYMIRFGSTKPRYRPLFGDANLWTWAGTTLTLLRSQFSGPCRDYLSFL